MKPTYPITDYRFVYTCLTDVGARFRAAGFVPREQQAIESEKQARIEGALRAMKYLQSLPPKATVTPITKARKS